MAEKSEIQEFNSKIQEGFDCLLLMSTFLSNEDLVIHIKEIQNDIKNE